MKKNLLVCQRYFVPKLTDPESLFKYKKFNCEIKDSKGNIFFQMKAVEAPSFWSQTAVDIAASKYFRKAMPEGVAPERSLRQLVNRVVEALRASAKKQGGYFKSTGDLDNFVAELKFILLSQRAAFNSPVWFNVGLWESYKIKSASEHFYFNSKTQKIEKLKNAYEHPQCSACFIQGVDDSIEGIFELAKNEAKLFKYGSGTGSNFSNLRSRYENTSSGGMSSGLISFLEVLDKGAGAIKSGGVTRRAAKMVVVDDDHPEVLDFINWKLKEEEKAKVLIKAGYDAGIDGEAYRSVSGQNANNSVRISQNFMKALEKKTNWKLRARTSGKVLRSLPASEMWQQIAQAAWSCAEPGLQFHSTINKWHTCSEDGEIQASNPCSEYMFLNDSACNLASVNLVLFLKDDGEFDFEGFIHTSRILFIAQEILVDYSSYPTEKIAENSHNYRPLGLGFANLGSLLMRMGLGYDSDEARAWAGALTAVMSGTAYLTSSELAGAKGPFARFKNNKISMLKVIKQHQGALKNIRWDLLPEGLADFSEKLWKSVVHAGVQTGYRNAQATVVAPTGTIGLLMDCDTTGIEPEFSLIKHKKLVGGGELEFVNGAVEQALIVLGYEEAEVIAILKYISQFNSLQGAPYIRPEHVGIFDCASGPAEGRSLSALSHVTMMAAVQPFISGAISKTVNLPNKATVQDIMGIYAKAHSLGLKSVSVYRDGSKGVQPLNVNGLNSNPRLSEVMKCPDCGGPTELTSGCYRCPNCGTTVGCA